MERIAAKKLENMRVRALPETQATKWVTQLGKQINDCKALITDIPKSTAPEESKKSFVKDFKAELKLMNEKRERLRSCTPEKPKQLIVDAPVLEVQLKCVAKRWKKVAKVLGLE